MSDGFGYKMLSSHDKLILFRILPIESHLINSVFLSDLRMDLYYIDIH